MNRLLFFIVFIISFSVAHSQHGYLFVKKGARKKRTYAEGERILVQLHNDTLYSGYITLLRNDTIFISGRPVPKLAVKSVIIHDRRKKKFHLEAKDLLLITGGVALTTAGLTLSKQADLKEAATAGLVIGYAPLLLRYAGSKISLKRRRFLIGKKFYLQMIDFHIPKKRAF
jgi:hypothetical protein